ncbi:hypothetical protein ACIBQ0_17635 [Nocardia nova]|uniref:hypothetical protein n=1 Tax=Nocardia nova TaxID=37330 RepID=UPI0037BA1616
MTIRLGPRDFEAMQWLAEMRGAPMHVVAQLLGCSISNAQRIVDRWRKAGLVIEKGLRPVPGPSWVVPNAPTASSMLNFTVAPWVPGPKDARHHEMTGRVRLALAGGARVDSWRSERILLRDINRDAQPGKPRPHLHDGHWTDDLGRLHAIEVELTRKGSADARTTVAAAYAAARAAGAYDLIYYCEPEVMARVRTAVQGLDIVAGPDDPGIEMWDLNQLLNPPAVEGRRLTAAGGAAS